MIKKMNTLNRDIFKKEIELPSLKVVNSLLRDVLVHVKKFIFKKQNFKPVQNETDASKTIFLNPELIFSLYSFPQEIQEIFAKFGVIENDFAYRKVALNYDNYDANEVIRSILPDSKSLSHYSIVGHIVQVNLKSDLLPYKSVIGEVLLDKIKTCKTVVNKVDIIENCFRNFKMELIAGSPEFVTIVTESGCNFSFDFSKVYWNPRLSTEHGRIISMLKHGDILYDIFCGVGPFSIPAAKLGCHVVANDLNPECCKWLEYNKLKNKVKGELIISNKDGFEFITNNLKSHLTEYLKEKSFNKDTRIHITMNLPVISDTFLPAFVGLLEKSDVDLMPDFLLPTIHLYRFIKNETSENVVKDIENILNTNITGLVKEVFNVRNVAPYKEMIRISFTLSKNILGSVDPPKNPGKRLRMVYENLEVKKQYLS